KAVNRKHKPYIVIEGLANSKAEELLSVKSTLVKKKSIMYAGALYEKFGLDILINSFMNLENDNIELWLFGSGDMEEKIRKYTTIDQRIKFFGRVDRTEILEYEKEATLLVNPRPSKEEFTKYSFPSKTIEYMASGTP